MSEYKENTVGWWLSQLKEPLKSRAFGVYSKPEWLDRSVANICDATNMLSWTRKGDTAFWDGVDAFFRQDVTRNHLYPSRWKGWDMAERCAPDNWLKPKDGGEDKAIVDSPAPEIPVTGAMIEDFSKRVKWPITREIEAPERAVVGYEEPKPIDTIEKKHELRIQALEAEIKNLYRLLNGKADKTIYGTR